MEVSGELPVHQDGRLATLSHVSIFWNLFKLKICKGNQCRASLMHFNCFTVCNCSINTCLQKSFSFLWIAFKFDATDELSGPGLAPCAPLTSSVNTGALGPGHAEPAEWDHILIAKTKDIVDISSRHCFSLNDTHIERDINIT